MDSLIESQTEIAEYITNVLKDFLNIENTNVTYAESRNRLIKLKDSWIELQSQHIVLLQSTNGTSRKDIMYFKENLFTKIESIYKQTLNSLMTWISKLEQRATASTEDGVRHPDHQETTDFYIIALFFDLSFSGDIADWERFRDQFEHLIISNKELSNVERMRYLRSCLNDKANYCIRTLPITDKNFQIAWDTLKWHYKNRCRLIHINLHSFFSLPYLSLGSAHELRSLRDRANIFVQSLQ